MKGLTGLIVAGALGLLAVGVNMAYLHNKTKNVDEVLFVGIKADHTIQPPKIISKDDIEAVPIPQNRAETLQDYAYLWDDRRTVVGIPATRIYRGGDLVFMSDYRTPRATLNLEPDETLLPIDVTNRSPLIEPGSQVSFLIPTMPDRLLPRGSDPDSGSLPSPSLGGAPELHGPFRVAALGNRISSREVMQAYGQKVVNENQLGIIAELDPPDSTGKRQYKANVRNLLAALDRAGNNRNVRAVLHSEMFDKKIDQPTSRP